MLKCSNCGADLKIDDSRMLKYCPYCGREVEMDEQAPDTVMGVFRSFGKSLLSQRAEQKRYEREHASEIAEEKRKTAREERKHMVKMLSTKVPPSSSQSKPTGKPTGITRPGSWQTRSSGPGRT